MNSAFVGCSEPSAFSFRLGPTAHIATCWLSPFGGLDSVQDLSLAEGQQMAHLPLISNFYSALGAGAPTGLVGNFPDNAVLIAFPTRGRFTGACLAGILVTVTFFCFAQRLRCASAIFFPASGESVLLFGAAATAGLDRAGRPLRLELADPAMKERASWRRAISSSKAAIIEDVFIPIR
jgi:hypothetical protein